jgi:hypothetical protein
MAYYQDPQGALHYLSDSDIANGGVSLLPAGCMPITEAQADAIQNPPLTLAKAQATQIATLRQACATAIVSGFASAALGSTSTYPSAITDQANQQTMAGNANGGSLWCETGGAWSFKAHTQAQAQTVVSSFAAWLNACQAQLVTLTEQVTAATSVDAVKAVEWANPTGA